MCKLLDLQHIRQKSCDIAQLNLNRVRVRVLNILPETILIETLKTSDREHREIVEAVCQRLVLPQLGSGAPPTPRTPPDHIPMSRPQMKQRRVEQVPVCFLTLRVHDMRSGLVSMAGDGESKSVCSS
jgi:hypothetical protein